MAMIANDRPIRHIGMGDYQADDLTRRYVNEVLDSGRLTYGPFTVRFEQEFAKLHERRFAMFCNSGTSALQAAVHALKRVDGWADGDEVLVPTITFVASSNVVIQNRLVPKFVDVDPNYFELDLDQLEAAITPRTRAIMPVHLFGQSCDMEPILDIARRHRLRVIEDSCEAMFVQHAGHPVGSLGDVACFSTYVAHLLTTGVGGLAATNDPDIALKIKSLFNHGRDSIYVSIDDDDDLGDAGHLREVVSRRFNFTDVGYSYRATELEAAIGLAQLQDWEGIIRPRQRNAEALTEGLSGLSEYLQLPAVRPGTEHGFMMYPLVVREGKVNRDKLIMHLESHGIETRYLMPVINQPVYGELYGDLESTYPVAKRLNRDGFYIGCHQLIGTDDIAYIIDVFQSFFAA
jgi:dTDP-4-amino-4,6-dideoxygalactose transaminase